MPSTTATPDILPTHRADALKELKDNIKLWVDDEGSSTLLVREWLLASLQNSDEISMILDKGEISPRMQRAFGRSAKLNEALGQFIYELHTNHQALLPPVHGHTIPDDDALAGMDHIWKEGTFIPNSLMVKAQHNPDKEHVSFLMSQACVPMHDPEGFTGIRHFIFLSNLPLFDKWTPKLKRDAVNWAASQAPALPYSETRIFVHDLPDDGPEEISLVKRFLGNNRFSLKQFQPRKTHHRPMFLDQSILTALEKKLPHKDAYKEFKIGDVFSRHLQLQFNDAVRRQDNDGIMTYNEYHCQHVMRRMRQTVYGYNPFAP